MCLRKCHVQGSAPRPQRAKIARKFVVAIELYVLHLNQFLLFSWENTPKRLYKMNRRLFGFGVTFNTFLIFCGISLNGRFEGRFCELWVVAVLM